MSDRFPRCNMCGRLVLRLAGEFCSDQCQKLARSGYASPQFSQEALRPPNRMLDARAIVTGRVPHQLPRGCSHIGTIGQPASGRELIRISADSWKELERVIDDLRVSVRPALVEVLTFQRFVSGGLPAPQNNSPGQ
jgi:hypothetical protein